MTEGRGRSNTERRLRPSSDCGRQDERPDLVQIAVGEAEGFD